jgi:PelA/Pel-15E family pectate lyase
MNYFIFRNWKLVSFIVLAVLSNLNLNAQSNREKSTSISTEPFGDSMRHWYGIRDEHNIINPMTNQPKYADVAIEKIADNVLLYQRENGGWPKNYDITAILTPKQADSLVSTKNILNTTFDNSTTFTHVQYLAKAYTILKNEKYKLACLKGIQFILTAQYKNGGWPQYYPLDKKNYSRHITFNDGAYMGIMETLKLMVEKDSNFNFIDKTTLKRIKIAYDKGLDCILKMQIVDNNRLTMWCQQHDDVTLLPTWARAFEPPSICNGESTAIVLFLMNIDHPSKEIIKSVQSAVKWIDDSKIYNTKVITIPAPVEKSKWATSTEDKIVVTDITAPPIWTRYYELGSNKPLFCDRNSKYLYSLAEVSRERRSGYSWYTYAPSTVLKKYVKWQNKWVPNENVLLK